MLNIELPKPIESYFAAKGGTNQEETLTCFNEDAIVRDNGEDLVLTGTEQIRGWLTGTVTNYNLSSEIKSAEPQAEGYVVGVVVSGDFPGSPYEFAYRFTLCNDKISELAIDPIGSVSA